MLNIRISGRDYPYPDLESLTFRELNMIKKLTGLRLGELADALGAGDADAIIALAAVAKVRLDGDVDSDALYSLTLNEIEVVVEPDPVEDEGNAEAPEASQVVVAGARKRSTSKK